MENLPLCLNLMWTMKTALTTLNSQVYHTLTTASKRQVIHKLHRNDNCSYCAL